MVWYALAQRSWLETRWRLVIVLGFMAPLLAALSAFRTPAYGVAVMVGGFAVWSCSLFAGAGIAARRPFGSTTGGSALFTVSLPVSRFQLLAVRAGLGWLEMTGGVAIMCLAIWFACPAAKATATETLEHAGALVACTSGFYFLFVLSAAFLDGKAQVFGVYTIFAAVWWLSGHTALPASLDVYRAMGEGSPLVAHTMPWSAMAFSLGLAAVLFFAALRVVQAREY